jgi:hypothetical protein
VVRAPPARGVITTSSQILLACGCSPPLGRAASPGAAGADESRWRVRAGVATVRLALQARGEASIGGDATGAPVDEVSFGLSPTSWRRGGPPRACR